MSNAEHFREFLAQFFKPDTKIPPSAVSVKIGKSSTQLIYFLSGERGIPRASTLRLLVPELRQRLEQQERSDLLPRCTVVRFLIEAGYMGLEDVGQFLEVEGYQGWMRLGDCIQGLDLSVLSPAGQALVRELFAFQLVREGKAITPPEGEPEPVAGEEPARELVRDRGP